MNKILLILFFSCFTSIYPQEKRIIDEVKSKDGKSIIIFSDKTWDYEIEGEDPRSQINNRELDAKIESKAQSKSSSKNTITSKTYNNTTSTLCGARTKKGGSCQRRVKGGGRCWQH